MSEALKHFFGDGIPPVSAGQPYVYIDTLTMIPETSHIWDQAIALVDAFKAGQTSLDAEDKRTMAVQFLYKAANFQRQGEMAFIENEINKIENELKTLPDEQLQSLLKNAKYEMEKLRSGDKFDYQKYTSILNDIMLGTENFKARLRTLKENMQHKKKEHGLLEDAGTEIKNIVTLLTDKRKKLVELKNAYPSIVAEFISSYIEEHKDELTEKLLKDDKLLAGFMLKLSLRFRQFMERERMGEDFLSHRETYEQMKERLREKWNKYLEETKPLELSQQDIKDLKTIATSMEIQDYESLSKEQKKTGQGVLKLPTFRTRGGDDQRKYLFIRNLSSPALSERLNAILPNRLQVFVQTGGSNMGDDSIAATLNIEYGMPNFDAEIDLIDDTLKKLDQATTEFSNARTDRENMLAHNAKMNQAIEDTLKDLDQKLNALDPNSRAFIIHDSDKYYQSIEQGFEGAWHQNEMKRVGGFGGRTLSILNYIDVMRNLTLDLGIGDPDLMYFVAINLDDHSPAAGQKDILEDVFTRAASLIMFDDIAVAMKEVTGDLEFSNITNIHLYKLQTLFVPSSYIIEETAKYLEGCPYDQSNAAVAQIQVGHNIYSPYYENLYKEGSSQYNDVVKAQNRFTTKSSTEKWETVKSYMASQTKVSIHFFLNFQNFISGIPR